MVMCCSLALRRVRFHCPDTKRFYSEGCKGKEQRRGLIEDLLDLRTVSEVMGSRCKCPDGLGKHHPRLFPAPVCAPRDTKGKAPITLKLRGSQKPGGSCSERRAVPHSGKRAEAAVLSSTSVVVWRGLPGLLAAALIPGKRETASSVNNVTLTGGRMTGKLATR